MANKNITKTYIGIENPNTLTVEPREVKNIYIGVPEVVNKEKYIQNENTNNIYVSPSYNTTFENNVFITEPTMFADNGGLDITINNNNITSFTITITVDCYAAGFFEGRSSQVRTTLSVDGQSYFIYLKAYNSNEIGDKIYYLSTTDNPTLQEHYPGSYTKTFTFNNVNSINVTTSFYSDWDDIYYGNSSSCSIKYTIPEETIVPHIVTNTSF